MTQSLKRQRRFAWLAAALMTAALFTAIILFLNLRYAQNDDTAILRSFMGYETGTPAHFSIYVHGLLAWPLYWLATAFPTVAWFSVLQLALLVLANILIQKSIIQCFVNHRRSFFVGVLFAALFTLTFSLDSCTHITFTQTAALLGAASVLQMLSIPYSHASDRAIVGGMLLSLLPVVMAYCIRQVTALPILAFCGVAFVACAFAHFGFGKRAMRPLKPMLVSLLIVGVVMGTLVGVRELELAQNDVDEYMAWQNARSSLLDYYGADMLPQEALDEVGWSEATRQLANGLCFLESDISTESLETLLAYMRSRDSTTFGQRLQRAFAAINERVMTDDIFMRSTLLFALVFVMCIVFVLMRRERRALTLCTLGVGLLLFVGLLLYLGINGRLPLRAVLMAFLPLCALVMGLLPACMPDKGRGYLPVLAIGALLCCCVTGYYVTGVVPQLTLDEEFAAEVGEPAAFLDEYALYEPDMLFIYDISLAVDSRLFPDVSEGIPTNVTFWGGWTLRSPASVQQFANFGYDLSTFSAKDLLNDNILIASGIIDPPPMLLLNYLRERVDPNVDYEIYGEDGGIYYFQFIAP